MPKTGIDIDTREFQAALKQYVQHSKRDLAFIVNKRAINVSFLALKKTPTATAKRIERDLRKRVSVPGRKGKGRPPKAALLIASGSAKVGLNHRMGLYGAEMRDEISRVIKQRQRSRGYVKSGWLQSIRDLERNTPGRKKRKPRNVQTFSRLPGEGRAARQGINPTAQVLNHASDAYKIAARPLQAALDADALDMRKFTAKRMQQTANKFR